MPADAHDGAQEDQEPPDYAVLPTDARRLLWYWRVRIAFASTPVVALMLADAPAAVLFLGGAAWCAAGLAIAARLARTEARVRAIRAERERR